MKAEHRKELQTNVLAERLGQVVQTIKEGPSRGTVIVLSALAVVVLLYFAWRYFQQSSQEAESERWYKWDTVASPEQLKALADDTEMRGTLQERLARFQMARRHLADGLRDLGFNRASASENIRQAAEKYGKLADESSDHPVLLQEALLGAAKANESLGELEKARSFYTKLAQQYPTTALGKDAQKQLERLDAASAGKDLDELRKDFGPAPAPAGTP
jgi:hypothetical protein